MILNIKNKYTKINIIKLINTLNLNFIIFNNKLIFTHTITQNNIKPDPKQLWKKKQNPNLQQPSKSTTYQITPQDKLQTSQTAKGAVEGLINANSDNSFIFSSTLLNSISESFDCKIFPSIVGLQSNSDNSS